LVPVDLCLRAWLSFKVLLLPCWDRSLPLLGFVRSSPSPPTHIRESTPGPEGPSVSRARWLIHVPPPRFRTALTVFSSRMLRACCIPLPDGGFAAFPACFRAGPRTVPNISRFPRRASHPPKVPPRQQPRRVTTALAFLPSSSVPPLVSPFLVCRPPWGVRSLPSSWSPKAARRPGREKVRCPEGRRRKCEVARPKPLSRSRAFLAVRLVPSLARVPPSTGMLSHPRLRATPSGSQWMRVRCHHLPRNAAVWVGPSRKMVRTAEPVSTAGCSDEPRLTPTSRLRKPPLLRREARVPGWRLVKREVKTRSTRCLLHHLCDASLPRCRTRAESAGRPASRPCSTDESVTSPSLPRVDVLSFHGLGSPSRSLPCRRGVLAPVPHVNPLARYRHWFSVAPAIPWPVPLFPPAIAHGKA
jgi:hypothetical protein